MGHLHPDQFTELVAPSEYVHDWRLLAHEEDSPILKKTPTLREAQKRFVGNVEYDVNDLIKSVKERGVQKPVIISKQKQETSLVDVEKGDWQRDREGNIMSADKHLLIDGHHRAYAAMKAGRPIPVWIADEDRIKITY